MGPTFPSILIFVHILSALWLAAGVFGGAVVRAAGRREPELAARVAALRIGWRLAAVFGIPGSLLAGGTGLWLLILMPSLFRAGWIHVSITLWVLLLGLNLLYVFPHLRRTLAAGEASLAAGGPTDELKRLAASAAPRLLADLNAVAILIFVFLMSLKPF